MHISTYIRKAVVGVVVSLLVLVVLVVPVGAQEGYEPDLAVHFDKYGDVRACTLLGCLGTDTVNAVLESQGTGLVSPSFTPLHQEMTSLGFQSITGKIDGTNWDIGVNGVSVANLVINPTALRRAGSAYLSEEVTEDLLPFILGTQMEVGISFDEEAVLEPAGMVPVTSPVNFIAIETVITDTGEIVSVAGIQPQKLGIDLPRIPTTIMDQILPVMDALEMESANIKVYGNTLIIVVNGEQWISANLNMDWLYATFEGNVPENMRGIVQTGLRWISRSSISLHLVRSDEPSATPPSVRIEDPLDLYLNNKGELMVEGLMLPTKVHTDVMELIGSSTTIVFDGTRHRVDTSGGVELSLGMDKYFVQKVLQGYLGNMGMDPAWLTEVMSSMDMTARVILEDGNPPLPPATFTSGTQPQTIATIPVIIGADGSVGIYGDTIPRQLGYINTVKQYLKLLNPVEAVGVGTDNLLLNLEGSVMTFEVDGETRGRILDWIAEKYNLPFPAFLSQTMQNLMSLGDGQRVLITVEHVDESLAPGGLEKFLNWLLPGD